MKRLLEKTIFPRFLKARENLQSASYVPDSSFKLLKLTIFEQSWVLEKPTLVFEVPRYQAYNFLSI